MGVTDRLFFASSPYYGPAADVSASSVAGYDIVERDFFVGNPIERVDLRLSKTFTLKEHIRFVPIVEAFNLVNHSNFGSYSTLVNPASFGTPVQNTDLAYAARMADKLLNQIFFFDVE